ncbi:hypothetical protein ACFX1X_015564 [Malus domestica]
MWTLTASDGLGLALPNECRREHKKVIVELEHAVRTDLNFWWRKVKAAVVNNLFVLLHFLSFPIGGVLIFSGTETCCKAEVAQPRHLKLERRTKGSRASIWPQTGVWRSS